MPSLIPKDRVSLCQLTFANGRHHQMRALPGRHCGGRAARLRFSSIRTLSRSIRLAEGPVELSQLESTLAKMSQDIPLTTFRIITSKSIDFKTT
jgi:hypothetical protein